MNAYLLTSSYVVQKGFVQDLRSNLAGDRAGAGGVGGDEGELPKHIINSVPRYVHPSLTRLAYQ